VVTHPPHARCFACGPNNPAGLRLGFHLAPDRSVTCRFQPAAVLEGYPQVLHDGVVATLLGSAMAHCLFAQGHTAYASELTIRYLAPVLSSEEIVLDARFLRGRFPECVLEARLVQGGQPRASAKGSYAKQPRVALGLASGRPPRRATRP